MDTFWQSEALFTCVGIYVSKLAFAESRISVMSCLHQQKQSPILVE